MSAELWYLVGKVFVCLASIVVIWVVRLHDKPQDLGQLDMTRSRRSQLQEEDSRVKRALVLAGLLLLPSIVEAQTIPDVSFALVSSKRGNEVTVQARCFVRGADPRGGPCPAEWEPVWYANRCDKAGCFTRRLNVHADGFTVHFRFGKPGVYLVQANGLGGFSEVRFKR